jgi:hypothetical protein
MKKPHNSWAAFFMLKKLTDLFLLVKPVHDIINANREKAMMGSVGDYWIFRQRNMFVYIFCFML